MYKRQAHALGRAGIDQVAGFQAEVARQVGDGLGHRPDQLADVAALLVGAVDLQPDAGVVDVAGLRGGCLLYTSRCV